MGDVGREGPAFPVASCSGCRHLDSVAYRVQGDSGRDYYCAHPDVPRPPDETSEPGRWIGDYDTTTPAWCPFAFELEIRLDPIGALCRLVEKAGGTMTLHGQPIDAEGLRAAAKKSATERLASAIAKGGSGG